ncbi:P-loop NTPase [Chelatococcus sp. SYSU_G07232]|uniref:P-loop NTPase n=1 Tax=Chelatococcus albus TaxID=3047466 RepID=A0ABT7AE69_9HYPH|nr:P-loop NTPase [Chelatococcus sp. SYSU_G07232]MDJ1157643.1 P-loop NTPase [Chelatococcus sp. SYSU_G07232]
MLGPDAAPAGQAEGAGDRVIAPVPHITLQAFCETAELAAAVQAAAGDRRMQKALLKVQMGGATAAVEAYRHAPTPNVILIEASGEPSTIVTHLDALAEVCDPGTKVIVVGHVNDVILYRELMRRGVSEYLITPIDALTVVSTVSEIFHAPGADPIGRTIAVVGAKGGVGASTIAHNLAWAIARNIGLATVIADLDIAFGTAGLDFNQDPPQGIAEAVFAPDRLDTALVERLLSKCSDNLSLLAAPAMLDRTCDLPETALDGLADILRNIMPAVVFDVPHVWTAWVRHTLIATDDIVVVAAPDLASLRNAKNLFDLLRQTRANDRLPKLVMNQIGLPKRPEIAVAEFAKALGIDIAASIPFDAQLFGTAANNGQMIAEVQAGGKIAEAFVELAAAITGRTGPRRSRSALFEPLLAKLALRRA